MSEWFFQPLLPGGQQLAAPGPNVRVLQDLNSVAVTDDKVMLRARDRESLDTSVVVDALNRAVIRPERLAADTLVATDAIRKYITRRKVSADYIQYVSDALWIPDVFSYARRTRNRAQLDTSVVTDLDVSVVLHPRVLLDTISVVDSIAPRRLRDRESIDTLAATDAIAPRRLRDRESLDTATATDDSVELRERYRVSFDTIVVLDDKTATYIPGGTGPTVRVLQDLNSCAVTDSISALRLRDRESLDTSVIVDFDVSYKVAERGLFDSCVVTDVAEIVLRKRNRVKAETIELTDALVPVIGTILQDSLTVADGSTPTRKRQRQLTDSIDISETQASVRRRIRVLSDSINVTDSFIVTASGQTKRVTDSIDVTDSLVATYFGDLGQFYITHGVENVNFEHGMERVHFLVGLSEETI